MTFAVSITSQGQMTIPAKARRELGLKKNSRALVSIEDGKMVVKPVKDLLELRGSLKINKKPLSPKKMRELFENYLAEEAVKGME